MLTALWLGWVAIYALTELFKWLQKRFWKVIDTKIIVAILAIITGAIYYYFTKYQPDLWKQVAEFTLWVFAVSQWIRMILEKYIPNNIKQPITEVKPVIEPVIEQKIEPVVESVVDLPPTTIE